MRRSVYTACPDCYIERRGQQSFASRCRSSKTTSTAAADQANPPVTENRRSTIRQLSPQVVGFLLSPPRQCHPETTVNTLQAHCSRFSNLTIGSPPGFCTLNCNRYGHVGKMGSASGLSWPRRYSQRWQLCQGSHQSPQAIVFITMSLQC